ncbi:MAG: DUF1592 domain-containing protein [Planctomycetota bacterium]
MQSDHKQTVSFFLNEYCIGCHDVEFAEGDREFESFTLPLTTPASLITADEIIDQVTLREMPPNDADQPSDQERIEVLAALRRHIDKARRELTLTGSRTVMRRLSHREYENTLAALFDRRVDTLGLTADFPRENSESDFKHVGQSMVTSGFLLDQYFGAANRLVDMRLAKPLIEPQRWHFTDNFKQYEELAGPHQAALKFKYLCLYEQPNTDSRQGGYGHIEDFLQGVPVSGTYEIQIHAAAMHRDTHYAADIFKSDLSEPFLVAVVPGDITKGHIHYPQAIEPILARDVVPDDEPDWLTFRVWLEAGQTPRFIFPNGPYESREAVININKRYQDEFSKPARLGVTRTHLLREGKLPHIRIGEIKIHGPLQEAGGSRELRAVFGEGGFDPRHAADQLQDFARRAFRRPLNQADRTRIDRFYDAQRERHARSRGETEQGDLNDAWLATLDTLKMILCSPSFLYLSEITDDTETRLEPHDLATRLSYALWVSPPDESLTAVADNGQIAAPEVLYQQIMRLLDHPQSDQFVNSFLDSWLGLSELGDAPPPREKAEVFYAEDLPRSMKTEARLFFRHLIDHDLPIRDLIDAQYTFVDKKLARLYGLPEGQTMRLADGFQKIELPADGRRGGVLGMAGVLTVSANGVETSPVTRGVWVLENLLGVTPPPPPDEVPEIEADVSGAKTIRERLSKHSQDATCSVCHRRIDPLGYALETFDPIGRWRDRYGKSKRMTIDSSGMLPSGDAFANVAEFRSVLQRHRLDAFRDHLISQLLTYATGRHMELADQAEMERIADQVKTSGDGLRMMIFEVFQSDIFQSR